MTNFFGVVRSKIYDILVLRLTTKWYDATLRTIPKGSIILDVGIGNASALIACTDLLRSRENIVVGADYDKDYVTSANSNLKRENLEDIVAVSHIDLYTLPEGQGNLKVPPRAVPDNKIPPALTFDAVYFSGSFSLLPDPIKALSIARDVLRPGGKVYITQTYQRYTPPLLGVFKPLIKYICSIDFGKVVTEGEAEDLFQNVASVECGLELERHEIIQGSVSNSAFQAAYLTVLKPK
eukprot:CAMPEP_0194068878 /NCGR_PEP_ID=MMETSP0009_2-20130614/87334_1 /TAXON_ID=210454 /ORGANISM="Grammatophora oceanica, Strain CCMP 410" /LENGTH=236 /DNA_ID=CAMNT_0038722013 /DNA_START=25 /DNA_END=735 /DNA_ORIENTATION=+